MSAPAALGSSSAVPWYSAEIERSHRVGPGSSMPQARLRNGGCELIRHDDIAADFLMAEGLRSGDGRFDQIHAGGNVRDQGHEIGNDGAMGVVLMLRRTEFSPRAAFRVRGPLPGFSVSIATCALSRRPVQIRVGTNPMSADASLH